MSKHLPKVSIVTPSLNQAQFLEETIQSVLNQEYPNIELLVIDGGSTDESLSILEQYDDQITYWISEPDNGQTNAINKGLSRATGDILGWLNSDDTLVDGAIRRIIDFLHDNPNVDLVYGPINLIDQAGEPLESKNKSALGKPFSPETMIGDREVNQPGSFWTREIMEQVGLLDEEYQSIMDYEYWTRILLAGGKIARMDGEPVANFRITPSTKTKSQAHLSGLEELKLIDELLRNPRLNLLDINPQKMKSQIKIARVNASLKIFKSFFLQTGRKWQAMVWFLYGIRHDPLLPVTRKRFLMSVLSEYLQQKVMIN